MSTRESARELLERWRAGDQAAAGELYRRYAQRLLELAEGQIGRHLRRRLDADDVVQSAFRSFFRRAEEGAYSVEHSGALWRLLIRITLNKARNQAKRHAADKRDVGREECLRGEHVHPEAVADDPTPEEVLALAEELETMLSGAKQFEKDIVGLCLEGHSTSEIADQVHSSRWTVNLVLKRHGERLRARLQRYSEE